jgi:UDP-3-O-[3-hydroxymyristoyl] glucosamine N-acyltransferase
VVTPAQIAEAFPHLVLEVVGSADEQLLSADAPQGAKKQSLVFLSRKDAFETGLASEASALVVDSHNRDDLVAARGTKTVLVVPSVDLAMALIISKFFFKTPYQDQSWEGPIHPRAVIDPSVKLGENVRVAAGAVIAAGVELGAHSFIGANAVIERGVMIGSHTTIHPLVYIGHSCVIGSHCEIMPHTTIGKEGFGYGHDARGNHFRIPHQGRVILEDHVHIGSSCTIDRGTFKDSRLGEGTKIDNQCHLGHNALVGKGCLLTAYFTMAGSGTVGNFVIAGGHSTITGHVKVADQVQLGAFSVVSKDVPKAGDYAGFPLMPLQENIKMRAALLHLSEMRKQVSRLVKKVFPEES